ncbi:MAG TPA: glycosyltransferase family 1 protein [Streptosporangiaceae bacterium]|nr:glycosyltransferase family 1 protein [Streptosporangiaceae bacterium]
MRQVTALPPEAATLRSRHIGIDARYLKRAGIGISWYLHRGICELLSAQARVTLLTDDAAHGAALLAAYPPASVIVLPGRSGFIWEQWTLRRHLASSGYDGFIAPANYGLPLAYRGPTRLILVVHDLIPLRLPHLYLLPRPLWSAKYLLSIAIAAARADHIVAVSQATARDVARLLRRPVAGVVYPPIPRPASAQPGDQIAAPAAAGRQTHTPQPHTLETASPAGARDGSGSMYQFPERYFVYNGGTDVRKNVPMLLRAFARVRPTLPGADLVIIGAGYECFRREIGRLGIAGQVHLPGYVDDAAKTAILANALALVYPSRLEGFGLPVVEAFAAGIPVISGTGGSLREVGGSAATYVEPLDERSLAAAMATVAGQDGHQRAVSAGTAQLELLWERRQAATFARTVASCLPSRAT